MKKLLVLPFCLLTHAAVAATSLNLSVTGTIEPPSCDIALAGTGQVDYGNIVLNPTGITGASLQSQRKDQALSISCLSPAYTGLRLVDNRTSSVPGTANATKYGLGFDSANNPIGYFNIAIKDVLVDGGVGQLKVTADPTAGTWAAVSSTALIETYALASKTYAFDSATTPTTVPKAMTTMTGTITVGEQIQPRNTLDTTTEIVLDGSATFELIYL
ncbi:DUF1120 domain-containing protein [Pseudomonas sp. NPDC086251]|uniref:DUF1120 domain-containing protein n=1 Tax=Pseudomonas sp. NPDC086251 TaxID=3364431 RepID=UPI0038328313